ncbi:MAG: HD domain-containing protein [Nitrosopumilaceae archaeon]|nr:HD domain-containing protein [Nitrosopumilaceae archaeon]NIU02001.1 HD domain-containing protein [Nitrosopumilaceae archaeon]NIU87152.1 HD domain-containing protein [Nitrosopumilaceae archaeon]NIV64642.1 HD domain-containing protein [Nitrosopumilaceae archaeon]NIX62602.1 HD domain-containing protein [Nitrosopumilaceae archaeon]
MLDFFEQAANLKNIKRQGWIDKLGIKNPESVAEHCYSMSVLGMVLSELENLDTSTVLKMVILHDLAESRIGDITPEQMNQEKKNQLEDITICKMLDQLPKNISVKYKKIWNDYKEKQTAESIFVHEIDKLEMILQAVIYSKNSSFDLQLDTFVKTAQKEIQNKRLKEILAKLLQMI